MTKLYNGIKMASLMSNLDCRNRLKCKLPKIVEEIVAFYIAFGEVGWGCASIQTKGASAKMRRRSSSISFGEHLQSYLLKILCKDNIFCEKWGGVFIYESGF